MRLTIVRISKACLFFSFLLGSTLHTTAQPGVDAIMLQKSIFQAA